MSTTDYYSENEEALRVATSCYNASTLRIYSLEKELVKRADFKTLYTFTTRQRFDMGLLEEFVRLNEQYKDSDKQITELCEEHGLVPRMPVEYLNASLGGYIEKIKSFEKVEEIESEFVLLAMKGATSARMYEGWTRETISAAYKLGPEKGMDFLDRLWNVLVDILAIEGVRHVYTKHLTDSNDAYWVHVRRTSYADRDGKIDIKEFLEGRIDLDALRDECQK